MLRFVRVLVILWLLSSAAVLIPLNSAHNHPCDIPIVRVLGRQTYSEDITDFRTGITLSQEFTYRTVDISVNETYRYRVDYDAASEAIYVASLQEDSWRLLYLSEHHVQPYWSANSQSLFIYEYATIDGTAFAQGIFAINVASGETWFEHNFSSPESSTFSGRSPGNRYLYIRDTGNRASIDTLTGEITFFSNTVPQDYQMWSHDSAWVIRGSVNQIFVVHPKTGDFHPQLNQAIDGRYPQWTRNSIWFTRIENGVYTVWRASLLDGSIEQEHFNLSLRYVSPDDRWRVLVSPDDEEERVNYIYDSKTDTTYTEHEVSWVDFSDNGRCLLIVKLMSLSPSRSEVLAYDLETMTYVFRRNLGLRRMFRFFYGFHWYDEQYFDSVEGLYFLSG